MITSEDLERVRGWFTGRLPGDWSAAPADVTVDREEITVVLTIPDVDAGDASDVELAEARAGRARSFREETREARMAIDREAQHRYERKVSWGVRVGEHGELWTNVAAPGDDPPAPAAAAGARHPGRRRRGPVPLGGAGLVRAAGRSARGGLARRAPRRMGSVADVRSKGPTA